MYVYQIYHFANRGFSDRYNEIQQTRKKSQISVFFTINTQNKGACVCPSEPVIALIG